MQTRRQSSEAGCNGVEFDLFNLLILATVEVIRSKESEAFALKNDMISAAVVNFEADRNPHHCHPATGVMSKRKLTIRRTTKCRLRKMSTRQNVDLKHKMSTI